MARHNATKVLTRVRTHPGKSWNFIVQNSRPWKVLEKGIGPRKAWKILESPGIIHQRFGIVGSGLRSREADKQFLLIHCHLLGQIEY